MTRTEIQKAGFASISRHADRAGVAQFATHTPTYAPPSTSQYPYNPTTPTAGPSHRTALIGITGLALLLAAMGGIAFVRYQDTTVPAAITVAAARPVPHGALAAQEQAVLPELTVPHGALTAQELAVASIVVPAAGVVVQAPAVLPELTVPHGALAAQEQAVLPELTVPHGALAAQEQAVEAAR